MGLNPGRPLSYDGYGAELDSIRARLAALESGRRAGNTSITDGAMIVRDAGGVERARLGRAEDGSEYGLFVNTGNITGVDITGVNLSGSIITGSEINGAEINGSEITGATVNGATVNGATVNGTTVNGASINGGSFDAGAIVTDQISVTSGASAIDLGVMLFQGRKSAVDGSTITLSEDGLPGQQPINSWVYAGPNVSSIPVQGGSLLIVVSGYIEAGGSTAGCQMTMSYELSGPGGVIASPDIFRGIYVEYLHAGMHMGSGTSFVYAYTGLAAGNYMVRPAYYFSSVGATPRGSGVAKSRSVHVIAS